MTPAVAVLAGMAAAAALVAWLSQGTVLVWVAIPLTCACIVLAGIEWKDGAP